MSYNQEKHSFDTFFTPEEIDLWVRYFADIIIACAPVYTLNPGSQEAEQQKIIRGRGEIIFALHQHFVNITSSIYSNEPLSFKPEQQLKVGWNLTIPNEKKPITHDDYWKYFSKFISEELFLQLEVIPNTNKLNPLDADNYIPIFLNNLATIPISEVKTYMGLNKGSSIEAVLKPLVDKSIPLRSINQYKVFSRITKPDYLYYYLNKYIIYIKETLWICLEIERTKSDSNTGKPLPPITDEKLFIVYVYFLYHYYRQKSPLKSDKKKRVINLVHINFCPPKVISFQTSIPKRTMPVGFQYMTHDRLLALNQISVDSEEKLTSIDLAKVKNKKAVLESIINHSQDTLKYPEVKSKKRRGSFNTSIIILLCVTFICLISGGGYVVINKLEASEKRNEVLAQKLDQTLKMKQSVQKDRDSLENSHNNLVGFINNHPIPIPEAIRYRFINHDDPKLIELVEEAKKNIVSDPILDPDYRFRLVPQEKKPVQLIIGAKEDGVTFKLKSFGKSNQEMEAVYFVFRYSNEPNEPKDPSLVLSFASFGGLNANDSFTYNDLGEIRRNKGEEPAGTYVVIAMVNPFNRYDKSNPLNNIRNRVKINKNQGKTELVFNADGTVLVEHFLAFDVIDPTRKY